MQMSKERFKWLCYLTKVSRLVRNGIQMEVSLIDTNLMLLTAILNSCLVLDGGAEGLWVVVSPVSSLESRWLGEIP